MAEVKRPDIPGGHAPGLIPFLNARLDEDEAAANAAGGDEWEHDSFGLSRTGENSFAGQWTDSGLMDFGPEGDHAARHDPARVLREVAAKRARLAMFDQALTEMDRLLADDDAEKTGQGAAIGRCEAARAAVELDAAVYSDHPDYRQQERQP